MRHLKAGRKLHVSGSHRKAMFRNMVTSLMLHGRIRTTDARAKELRRIADRLITLGKRVPPSALEGLEGEALAEARRRRVHAIRQARRWITNRQALDKLFNDYAELYKQRPGGYTRVLKLGHRPGDNARMSIIELVKEPYPPEEEPPVAEASEVDDFDAEARALEAEE